MPVADNSRSLSVAGYFLRLASSAEVYLQSSSFHYRTSASRSQCSCKRCHRVRHTYCRWRSCLLRCFPISCWKRPLFLPAKSRRQLRCHKESRLKRLGRKSRYKDCKQLLLSPSHRGHTHSLSSHKLPYCNHSKASHKDDNHSPSKHHSTSQGRDSRSPHHSMAATSSRSHQQESLLWLHPE